MITPWGKADSVEKIMIGNQVLYSVSTPSHGGYLVPKSLAAKMPEHLQRAGSSFGNYLAFEEDCAWSAVYLAFPEVVRSSWPVTAGKYSEQEMTEEAAGTFKRWYPELVAQ